MEENITRIKLNPESPEKKETPVVETEKVESPKETESDNPELKDEVTPSDVEAGKEPAEEPKQDTAKPIDIDLVLKEKIGLTSKEVEQLKKEYESMKGRRFIDDDELLPDDDFLKDFIKTYKRGGDVTKYLEAKTRDFGKMSDEEIVKYELRKNNPEMPEKFLNRMYNDYLEKQFGIQDEYESPEDEEYAKEKLRLHTQRKRSEFTEDLKKFQVPERKAIEPEADANAEKAIEEFNSFIADHPITKGVYESGKVVFDDFNYTVDADELKNAALDSSNVFKLFLNDNGDIDLDKFYKVFAIGKDPGAFLKARDAHVIAKAKLEWMKEQKNPSIDPPVKPPSGKISVRIV